MHLVAFATDQQARAGVLAGDDIVDLGAADPALPTTLRGILAGERPSSGVGLCNVDERLRQVYGDAYGLVIETGVGAGMKITVRLPKYRAGVHPGQLQ